VKFQQKPQSVKDPITSQFTYQFIDKFSLEFELFSNYFVK